MTKGQVIIEALIAFAIAMVAILGFVHVTNKSVSNSGFTKRQSEANTYAGAGLEWIRNQKNSVGWNAFKTGYPQGNYCYDGTTLRAMASCGVGEYTSTITIAYVTPTPSGPQIMSVSSQVSWSDVGVVHYSKQSADLVRY